MLSEMNLKVERICGRSSNFEKKGSFEQGHDPILTDAGENRKI